MFPKLPWHMSNHMFEAGAAAGTIHAESMTPLVDG
jgi:hypothetical protein